jgi:hypothetical protein
VAQVVGPEFKPQYQKKINSTYKPATTREDGYPIFPVAWHKEIINFVKCDSGTAVTNY